MGWWSLQYYKLKRNYSSVLEDMGFCENEEAKFEYIDMYTELLGFLKQQMEWENN